MARDFFVVVVFVFFWCVFFGARGVWCCVLQLLLKC